MTLLNTFDELRDSLLAAERATTDEAALPHALAAALQDVPGLATMDPALLLAELCSDPLKWPDQSWENYFGNAAITVRASETLRVDVLYWIQNGSTLHKHVSGGAFMALSGRRLHLEYDFLSADSLGTGVTFGTLQPTARSMMREASVAPISPALTHELYWIEKPSVTISVRHMPDGGSTRETEAQRPHEFVPPGAAYLPAAFQSTSNIQRWIDGLSMLRRANKGLYWGSLKTALTTVDEIYLIHVLDELCDNPSDEVDALLDSSSAAREDDALANLRAAVPEFRRRKLFSRVFGPSPDAQLLAALLWAAARGEELATLLKAEGFLNPEAFVIKHGADLSAKDPRIQPYVDDALRSLR